MIQFVFAHSNGCFGNNGDLPWPRIQADLTQFKKRTTGTVLIMGANTFQSLDKRLSDRTHVVLCRPHTKPKAKNGDLADLYVAGEDIDDCVLKFINNFYQHHVMYSVIGGPKVIESFIKNAPTSYLDCFYETRVSLMQPLDNCDVELPRELLNTLHSLNPTETGFKVFLEDGSTVIEYKGEFNAAV